MILGQLAIHMENIKSEPYFTKGEEKSSGELKA